MIFGKTPCHFIYIYLIGEIIEQCPLFNNVNRDWNQATYNEVLEHDVSNE